MTKPEFLRNIDNFSNHRILLWEALQLTMGKSISQSGKVVEFGSGDGSTLYLREHCQDTFRRFESYDSDKDWANKTGAIHITDWDALNVTDVDLLFLDHAPGERRKFDLVKYKDVVKIIVIHDSEPTGGGDYQVRQHFNAFRYCVEVKTEGAWSTMLSNYIDLSGLVGIEWDELRTTHRTKEYERGELDVYTISPYEPEPW